MPVGTVIGARNELLLLSPVVASHTEKDVGPPVTENVGPPVTEKVESLGLAGPCPPQQRTDVRAVSPAGRHCSRSVPYEHAFSARANAGTGEMGGSGGRAVT